MSVQAVLELELIRALLSGAKMPFLACERDVQPVNSTIRGIHKRSPEDACSSFLAVEKPDSPIGAAVGTVVEDPSSSRSTIISLDHSVGVAAVFRKTPSSREGRGTT